MHLFRVQYHALILLLILVNADSSLECHLNLAIVYLLLVLLSRAHVIHCEVNVVGLFTVQLVQGWLLIIVHSQDWVAFCSFLVMFHAFNRHHRGTASTGHVLGLLSKRS